MPRTKFSRLGHLAIVVYKEWAQMMCDADGKFQLREDGCCVHEDKEVGCSWHEFCKEYNKGDTP